MSALKLCAAGSGLALALALMPGAAAAQESAGSRTSTCHYDASSGRLVCPHTGGGGGGGSGMGGGGSGYSGKTMLDPIGPMMGAHHMKKKPAKPPGVTPDHDVMVKDQATPPKPKIG